MTEFHAEFYKSLLFGGNQVVPKNERTKPNFQKQCEILKGSLDREKLSKNIIKSLAESFPATFEIPLAIPNQNNSASRAPFLNHLKNYTKKVINQHFNNVPNIDMTKLSSYMEKIVMRKINDRIKSHSPQPIVMTRREMYDIFQIYYSSGCDTTIPNRVNKPTPITNEVVKIKKTDTVSVVQHVADVITHGGRFEIKKFNQNPELNKVIRQVLGREYSPNTEIPLEKVSEITALYTQRVMEIQLQKAGKLDAFKQTFSDYGGQLKDFWNMDRIQENFDVKGKNAMTIAGTIYGITTLFGIGSAVDSKWYKELTNLNAYKKSAKKKWKIFLAAGIGAQIAGVPLAETAGLVVRGSFNVLGQTAKTGVELFDSLFYPERWKEIVMGQNIPMPTPTEMLMLLPSIKNYFKPKYQKLLSQFYTAETGKDINLTDSQIDDIAYLTVSSADNLLKSGNSPDPMSAESWKNASIKSITDIAGFHLAHNPDPAVRLKYQKAINKYINLQRAKKLKPLVGVVDEKKFDEDFEKGAKKILSRMSTQEQQSILQMATSHGLSGLLVMAWIFIQGSLLAVQGIMYVGGKAFGKEKKETPSNEKKEAMEKAGDILNSPPESVDKAKWGEFIDYLKKAEIVKGKKLSGDVRRLKKMSEEDFRKVLTKLKSDPNFKLSNSENLTNFAETQKLFKQTVNTIKEKTIKSPTLTEITKTKKEALSDAYFFNEGLTNLLKSKDENYWKSDGKIGLVKDLFIGLPVTGAKKAWARTKGRFRNLFSGSSITTTGAAKNILGRLGIPSSRLDKIVETKKADRTRVKAIQTLIGETLKAYKTHNEDAKKLIEGFEIKD